MNKLILLICSLVLTESLPHAAFAQPSPGDVLRIRGIKVGRQQTPAYDVRRVTMQTGEVKEWGQILVKFETSPDWIDQLDFTFYALVKSDEGKNPYTLFQSSISYVNLERGKHESVMYLHPSTGARYGKVDRVALLVRMNGQLVGMESEPPSKQRWWEQLSPVQGYLLNRLQTPFAMINYDNYPAIKADVGR